MRTSFLFLIFVALCPFVCADTTADPEKPAKAVEKNAVKGGDIKWEAWSDAAFARAKKEKKFVIMDLRAIWCHWCHVMDETTYKDPAVIKLMDAKYIPVQVDQDSRPDLASRYEDYGWPATIVFNGDGKEIVKLQGYIDPKGMISTLQAIIDDPTPGPSAKAEAPMVFSHATLLTPELKKALLEKLTRRYDVELGSWISPHKFMDWILAEYLMTEGAKGETTENVRDAKWAKQTLTRQMALIDPVWGGVYQYSTSGIWTEPHFEKIMSYQAENLRAYALAYERYKDPTFLKAANEVERFISGFLKSPQGAFYTSQDADLVQGEHSADYFALGDQERRAKGIPHVDDHVYSRENGWAIRALTTLYDATGESKHLESALTAAKWILANRKLPGGGFSHDAKDAAGPFLDDSLAMGDGFLNLYVSTGDRQWLTEAETCLNFIDATFKDKTPKKGAGYFTTKPNPKSRLAAIREDDENVRLARFANLAFQYTGKSEYRTMSEQAMRYLLTPEVAKRQYVLSGVLLTDEELTHAPIQVTIVGAKNDADAKTLFVEALNYPAVYKRVEWYDKRDGELPNSKVTYPELRAPAAFACAETRCSRPAYKATEIRERIESLK